LNIPRVDLSSGIGEIPYRR